MSDIIEILKQIENLDVDTLAETLKHNGYSGCVGAIRSKGIDGQAFLNLTEVQISLWRLPRAESRKLWSFTQKVKEDPTQIVLLKTDRMSNNSVNSSQQKTTAKFHLKPSSKKPIVSTPKPDLNKLKNSKSEVNSSTLTNIESDVLKDKLKKVYKPESAEGPNPSALYKQRIKLAPKPNHLRLDISKTCDVFENFPNDDYLTPVEVEPTKIPDDQSQQESVTNHNVSPNRTNSFLSKFRKSYNHLQDRPNVVQNTYENKQDNRQKRLATQNRPLPPLPLETFDPLKNDDDETLAEYTGVSDDEELAEYAPISDDEVEEYTEVIEEQTSSRIFGKQAPPSPVCSTNSISIANNSEIQSSSNTLKNLSSENLPKPPSILPITSLDLPSPPSNFCLKKFNENTRPISSTLNKPPLKVINNLNSSLPRKFSYHQKAPEIKDDLTTEPCYRDTDRRGAELLLEGLEDGAFVIRPNNQKGFVCSFSIKHKIKVFNLRVIRQENGVLKFESTYDQPEFGTIKEIINYYTSIPLYLSGEFILLKNILSPSRR